jgi:hypothetical protein
MVCFYDLCRRSFPNPWIAVAGVAIVATSPRIFADAFYNVKDLVFLSAYLVALWTLVLLRERPTPARAALHGFASALAVDIRVMGVLVPCMTVAFLAVDVARRRGADRRRVLRAFAIYAPVAAAVLVLLWPRLWANPVVHLYRALVDNGRFEWHHEMLFGGTILRRGEVPALYVPVWIAITTPLPYLALIAAGVAITLGRVVRAPFARASSRAVDVLAIVGGIVPVLAVIALRARLYDGWRHLYFVYPMLVLCGLNALDAAVAADWRYRGRRVGVAVAAGAAVLAVLFAVETLALLHPYENVYFNRLAGPSMAVVKTRFDLDYWGLTFRRGLEYVARHDRRPAVVVSVSNPAGLAAAALLPAADRERLRFTDTQDWDYFVTNYRWHPGDYPLPDEVFALRYEDAKLLSVFRNPALTGAAP